MEISKNVKKVGEKSAGVYGSINAFCDAITSVITASEALGSGNVEKGVFNSLIAGLDVLSIISPNLIESTFGLSTIPYTSIIIGAQLTWQSFEELAEQESLLKLKCLEITAERDPFLGIGRGKDPFKTDTMIRHDLEAVSYMWRKLLVDKTWRDNFCAYINRKMGRDCPSLGFTEELYYKYIGGISDVENLEISKWLDRKNEIRAAIAGFLIDLNRVVLAEKRRMRLRKMLFDLRRVLGRFPSRAELESYVRRWENAEGILDKAEKFISSVHKLDGSVYIQCRNMLMMVEEGVPCAEVFRKRKERIVSTLEKYIKSYLTRVEDERRKIIEKIQRETSYTVPDIQPNVNFDTVRSSFPEVYRDYLDGTCDEECMKNRLFGGEIKRVVDRYEEEKEKIWDMIARAEKLMESYRETGKEVPPSIVEKVENLKKAIRVINARMGNLGELYRDLDKWREVLFHRYEEITRSTESIANRAVTSINADCLSIRRFLKMEPYTPTNQVDQVEALLNQYSKELEDILSLPIYYISLQDICRNCDRDIPDPPSLDAFEEIFLCMRENFSRVSGKVYLSGSKSLPKMDFKLIESRMVTVERVLEDFSKNLELLGKIERVEYLHRHWRDKVSDALRNARAVKACATQLDGWVKKTRDRIEKIKSTYENASYHLESAKNALGRAEDIGKFISLLWNEFSSFFPGGSNVYTGFKSNKKYLFSSKKGLDDKDLSELKRNLERLLEVFSLCPMKRFCSGIRRNLDFLGSISPVPKEYAVLVRKKRGILYEKSVLVALRNKLEDLDPTRSPEDLLSQYGFYVWDFLPIKKYGVSFKNSFRFVQPKELSEIIDEIRKLYEEKSSSNYYFREINEIKSKIAQLEEDINAVKRIGDSGFEYSKDSLDLRTKKIDSCINLVQLRLAGKNLPVFARNAFRKMLFHLNSMKRDWERWVKDYEKTRLEAEKIGQVELLYAEFSQYYSSKNLSGIMSLISPRWTSPDGSDIEDVEDILESSFDIFDTIRYQITGLKITPMGGGKYRVSYSNTIVGYIYSQRIVHKESSDVVEIVGMDGGRLRILKTIKGKFWKE